MSLLNSIVVGRSNLPPRILLYGYEGIGKSTFGANAEKPIFIQTEDGLRQLSVPKFPLSKSYQDVMDSIYSLVTEEHNFKTLVIDSLSKLEKFIWDDVCKEFKVKNIEKADGGYGKGYKHALDRWNDFLDLLDRANTEKNMTILLIAHVGTQEVKDPENLTFDRTAPRVHKLAEGAISQWCDCVFFAYKEIVVRETEEGFSSKRGMALDMGDNRIMRTTSSAAVIAKNRYNLPKFLPLDYQTMMEEINKN